MRKYLFGAFCLIFCTTAWAGDLKVGLEAGPSLTNFIGKGGVSSGGNVWDGYQINLGFNVGIFLDQSLSRDLSVELETSYVRKSSGPKTEFGGLASNAVYVSDYAEFYLLPKFHFPVLGLKAALFAGPSFGILVSNLTHFYLSDGSIDVFHDVSNDLNQVDYGLNAGMEFDLDHFLVSLRYQLGLENIQKSGLLGGLPRVQNQGLSLDLGYYL